MQVVSGVTAVVEGVGREGGGGDEEEMEENDGGHVAVFLNLVGYEIGGVGCTVNRGRRVDSKDMDPLRS